MIVNNFFSFCFVICLLCRNFANAFVFPHVEWMLRDGHKMIVKLLKHFSNNERFL